MIHTRRNFLIGICTALAAPAIVRASNLMPVRALLPVIIRTFDTAVYEIQDPWHTHMFWPTTGGGWTITDPRRLTEVVHQIAFQ